MSTSYNIVLGLVAVLYLGCDAYIPRMLHGRPRGGFVGTPGNKHRLLGSYKTPTLPPEQWFTQKLDHFNGADQRVWQQRYFVNDTYYKPGGPIFVQIGGEGAADPIWLVEGAWVTYGKVYGAYLANLEHRFYGKSHPTEDMSTENLRYLSSEQALADLAAFIVFLKESLGDPDVKVITFGGSYPGSLSAWFRLKYPHLVDGAVASSAPLLAEVNFVEYLQVVTDSLRTYDGTDACNSAVQQATNMITDNLATLQGRTQIKNMFRLCDSIDPNIQNDIANLYSTFAGNFEGVVQYNKDNRAFEGAVGSNITIDTLCGMMTDSSLGNPLQRYAKISNMLLDVYSTQCLDFKYDKMIDSMRQTAWSSSAGEGGRQWTYQTCTEFGFYQSSDYPNQPFGHSFPIKFWTTQCQDIFGSSFNDALINATAKRSNDDYGALGIKVSKVLFPNGSIDPWHALGVTQDLNPDARAIYINGTAHCANMYPSSPDDPIQLVQARKEIQYTIGQWLQS
ncbi:putative serine protease K12H4.7 [Physella acuta]|uniref:putative serine protease K12H4.7 n=1 Tax=Physella acuta TaxID=109671 RepID=UPI0027DEA1F1|nr:putative serine protease K12H4.7 [Physella acuta]